MMDRPHTSEPSVCFLGDGVSGSFHMRASQIAAMRPQWRTLPTADLTDEIIDSADVFCIVKRFNAEIAQRLRRKGKLVVYDVVDPWKQPDDGLANDSLARVLSYFADRLTSLDVDGMIFPNETMLSDFGRLVPNPICIYHHYRPGMQPATVREHARIVGYEGREDYLGGYGPMLERVCASLGLSFVVNPPDFHDIDIGFAGRDGLHGSLMPRRYKSNVKLANFMGAAIPAVASWTEASYREIDNGFVEFFESEQELTNCIQRLLPRQRRLEVHESFLQHRVEYSIETIAESYENYFDRLVAGGTVSQAA